MKFSFKPYPSYFFVIIISRVIFIEFLVLKEKKDRSIRFLTLIGWFYSSKI